MEGIREFLDAVVQEGTAKGNLLGLLHVLIGRKIQKSDGQTISGGMTWRDVAAELKRRRWNTDSVRDLGFDPSQFAPRDRQRFWYSVIARANVAGEAAIAAGDRFASACEKLGYVISRAPGAK